MKKKLLIIFFAITAAICCAFGFAACTNSYTISYSEIEENGEVIAYSVSGSTRSKVVEIPSTYNGKPVTAIDDGAFAEGAFIMHPLERITIPDSVTTIGESAFQGCYSLKSITIPDSVISIGRDAFRGSGIASIYYTGDLSSWCKISRLDGLMGYTDSSDLYINGEKVTGDLVVPDGVTAINCGAFIGCNDITSITLPEGITAIGDGAFADCGKLKSIALPDGVTSIGNSAFTYCSSLTSITLPDSVASIGNSAFYNCSSLTSITLPESLISIGKYAFFGCSGLKSITIPVGVTSIGEYAFRIHSSLESITVAEGNTVYHSTGNCLIETQSKTLILGCENSVIPDDGSVTAICDYAFGYCESFTEIIIPDGVTSIGISAFSGCKGLKSITIPDSVTTIGIIALYNCDSLTDINYTGTKEQWGAIEKGITWDMDSGNYTIHCIDGDIVKPVYE